MAQPVVEDELLVIGLRWLEVCVMDDVERQSLSVDHAINQVTDQKPSYVGVREVRGVFVDRS